MKILELYIGKTVIRSVLLALVVLLVLVAFGNLMEELGDVGEGNYKMRDAFFYVLLIIPRRAYEIFPVAVLLGSMIGLGGLASNSELTAMRAAGISLGKIIASSLKAGMVMVVIVIIIGELVAPNTEEYAETMRAAKLSNQITMKTKYGFWARDGSSFVNIRQILPGARLKDIYIYEFTEHGKLKLATHAGFAQYRDSHWLLSDIRQSKFTPNGVLSRRIKNASWDSMLNPSLLNVVVVRPTMLPAWGLYRYIEFMHENGQSAIPFEVAFWSKIFTPLVVFVMLYLSLPFVFGSLRTVGIGQRVFVGAIVGMIFLLMNKAFSHMSVVYQLDPVFASAFPGIACLGLAAWLVRKV